MNFLGKKRGFTLIEMLIVIVIIGVLASALIPRLGSARGKANDVARKADLQQLATAIISYQIDKNYFPGDASTIANTGFQKILKDGGMASIPLGDTSITWSGMNNQSTSGYMYYPMKKNGSADNGFILVAKTETEGGSNFILCANGDQITDINGGTDVESINICSSISFTPEGTCTPSSTSSDCIITDKAQLRYIYKY